LATTIAEAFEDLGANLEITDLQAETVSTRQKTVRAAVEDGLNVIDSFLAGSYRRNTMIAPLSDADIDIFMILEPEHFTEGGQADLLRELKAVLRKRYKTPDVGPNGQAVTIVFSDFRVDVVPCFYRKGGGYLIPDASLRTWIATDPKKHLTLWSEANDAHDGDFVPLVKMLKGWNRTRNVLRSFHLEALALKVLEGVTINSYPSGVRFFFDKARALIPVKLADPAGYSDDVGSYISTEDQIRKVVDRLDWAYDRAREAEALEARDEVKEAIDKWWTLFKDYFPSYG
jgi:hypothetical protein